MFGSSGFITEEEIARRRAERQNEVCVKYPAVLVEGHLVHVFEEAGAWHVWLNTKDMEFTGLCIGVGASRDEAVAQAVTVLSAVALHLQQSRT